VSTKHPEPSTGLADRVASVRARIAESAATAGRDASELSLIVVTKFHPSSLIEELQQLGVHDFGESRHQEAREKAASLTGEATWHFVGQLQSKKARQVRGYSRVIHSVDRPELVEALAGGDAVTDVFVQVNLTDDPARGGVAPRNLEVLATQVLSTAGLRLLGVMGLAPLDEEPSAAFARLRAHSEKVQSLAPEARAISAGTSGDFEAAIAEGATHLRVGTAITGERPPRL
jgi:pyridoxal phosphate enzyme (YggS family)